MITLDSASFRPKYSIFDILTNFLPEETVVDRLKYTRGDHPLPKWTKARRCRVSVENISTGAALAFGRLPFLPDDGGRSLPVTILYESGDEESQV
jgi:hypothetical protein